MDEERGGLLRREAKRYIVYALKRIAWLMDEHRVGVTVTIAATLLCIAVWNIVALVGHGEELHWFLMAAQIVATLLAAMWIIDAPRFCDSIDLAEDLFGGDYPAAHEQYRRNIYFFIVETGYKPGESPDGEVEAAKDTCGSLRNSASKKTLLSKIALTLLWALVGLTLFAYINEVTHDVVDVAIFILTALPAYAMNLISFYLCFVFTWHIVDVAKLASEGKLPCNWSQPSKTPGYMHLSRVSKQLNVCFLIVSLLFASLILLLSLYTGSTIPSSENGILFAACFVFTLLLGIVSFLYLHFVSKINLSVMLDSWEEQTWSKAMPFVSSEAVAERGKQDGDAAALEETLAVHKAAKDALDRVGEKPGFDSVDAASLTFAFLTLVVSAAALFRPEKKDEDEKH